MNKLKENIEDVQNTPDKRHLDIDKVGIKSIRHPISVKDKTGGDQSTIAMFDMYVHLPHNFKGTHMPAAWRRLRSSGGRRWCGRPARCADHWRDRPWRGRAWPLRSGRSRPAPAHRLRGRA